MAFLVSNNRGRIPWRTVAVGLAIQVAFAALVLRWSVGRDALEFVADQVTVLIEYTNAGIEFLFGKLVADEHDQTVIVTTFALAGIANFASIAIQIGSIGGLAPQRRGDVAQLGLKTLLAGSMVNLANAAIAGVVAA